MRLQLITGKINGIASACCLVLVSSMVLMGNFVKAQDTNQLDEGKDSKSNDYFKDFREKKKEIDVNFLFNYYDQDGDHAAVTGGTGTEALNDRAMKIVINVPLDSITNFHLNSHVNVYTSASTDNIDSNVSSASRHDLRYQMEIGYEKQLPAGNGYKLKFGGSSESDYLSVYGGMTWKKLFNADNSEIGLGLEAYFDTWLLIFPEELRVTEETDFFTTNRRKSFNLSFHFAQVFNKKLQASLSTDLVWQHGLLSTPFHRVYFQNIEMPKIERLPSSRLKFPVGLRLNYFATDFLIMRGHYRFYQDDFEINAHSLSLETPVKVSSFFSFYPFYRYHSQSAATFFKPFQQHRLRNIRYYTSDYDLSAFESHKIGLGLHFSPLYGIGRFKLFSQKRITRFKGIDLRAALYRRSDGLQAFLLSFDFAFTAN